MRSRKMALVAGAAALLLAVGTTACSSDDDGDDTGTTSSTAAPTSTTGATTDDTAADEADGDAAGSTAPAGLAVVATTEGEVLAVGGLPVYAFDRDTPESSSCVDDCATAWPPVPADVEIGSDVAVTTGTIARADGTEQLTVNGAPVYTFGGDGPLAADGTGTPQGQGVGEVWWVVGADGNPIRTVADN